MKLLAERKMVHYDAMAMIAERSGASDFIREIGVHPAFSDLRADLDAAADAVAETAKQMDMWWQIIR